MSLPTRRAALAATLAAAAFAVLGSTPVQAQDAPSPLRIGFVSPFTGGSADFGNSARLGAELAVKEINEVGGFLGRKLELVERDDKSTPDIGRQAAEDLVLKEKVAFTIGYTNTGVALKALDVFQQHKHLLMVTVSTGSAVTAQYPPESSYIFRLSARDTLQAALLIEDIVRRGHTKVAIFADKTGYGQGGAKDLEKFLAEKHLKPVYRADFDLGVKSLLTQVQEAKAAGADVMVGYTVAPELAVLATSRSEARFSGPLYGPWPLSSRTVVERAGAAAEGAIMVQTIIQDLSNERRTSFMARLKRYAGKQEVGSLMAAAQTYDAVYLLLHAMFQTGGNTDGDALKVALENLEKPYTGVVTSYDHPFSQHDHDAFSMNMIWLGQWRKGEVQFLYQDDAKRAGFIRRKTL